MAQTSICYHRAESSLPPARTCDSAARARSTIAATRQRGRRLIRTRGEIVARYPNRRLRLMVHWSCELFDDWRTSAAILRVPASSAMTR